jgi:maltose alpha-D-glucosyltransferase/alpha-amylase
MNAPSSADIAGVGAAQLPWQDDPLWYKDAIIYEIHVKAFHDSNGDGMGDFRGLTEKLDYIKDLGVNTIWLLPFYPSPLRDDGYDIADYRGIHPHYGNMADFRHFIREAHARNLKVITELVINHTSDQHPWFQAARLAPPGSSKRDYYVWSETAKKWPETRIIFTDSETSNWTWDPVAKAYYWHRFFSHQPDLNFNNPHVVKAVIKVMRSWFDAGVDGMRLDAIPYLCERDGTNNENLPETHAVLRTMRAELDVHYKNRFFLAEVNQWPEDVREYFGNGDECHMAYHFPLMPRIYMAVAEEDHYPIVDILAQTPDIPDNCQWAIFLRNHDELTLEMVTARERDYMYRMYAADMRARINVGIRRRLAPLMENNRRKIELVTSLLMSLVGSPILYYGDEIGMGDNFYLGDRHGVRTPMQWSPDRNGGFSRADPERLYLPPIMDPIYGYQAVNVEAQARSPSSLLNWTKRLIAVRKAYAAFGRGSLRVLRPGNRKVLAYLREFHDQKGGVEILLCVANLARSSQPVELNLREHKGRIPVELLGRTTFPPIGELPYLLTLPAWGFYWFSLAASAPIPEWHDERPVRADMPMLVIPEGLKAMLSTKEGADSDIRTLMARRMREQLERDVLPAFLSAQRWFAGKGREIGRTEVIDQDEWVTERGRWLLGMAHVLFEDGGEQYYAMPLALAWEDGGVERIQGLMHCTLARVRQRANVGVLYDAYWDDDFCRSVVASMGRADEVALSRGGKLVFAGTVAFTASDPASLEVEHPSFEQSNTLAILGRRWVLKGYRHLRHGINPEIEVGRFLTEVSPFPHIAPVAGSLEHRDAEGRVTALALLQAYVENQGSGWNYTVEYLGRFLDSTLASVSVEAAANDPGPPALSLDFWSQTPHAGFLALIGTLGKRTGELHAALGRPSGDPAFEPEPIEAADLLAWRTRVRKDIDQTLDQLAARHDELPEATWPDVDAVLAYRGRLVERVDASEAPAQGAKSRYHGDYHLGQVLLVAHDFVIVDFEGEPFRPLSERRAKHSPLRDVAGMLRSFHYAGAVALQHATAERPEDRARLEPCIQVWREQTEHAFLAAYFEAIRACATCIADPASAQRLIELFLMEKALYEVRYELDSRPEWVRIPCAGLVQIAASGAPE